MTGTESDSTPADPAGQSAGARKHFVLDTNVLLHDANALNVFSEHNVILTVDVLEELDRFKRGNDEKARNARRVIRLRDGLIESDSLNGVN